MCGIFGYAGSQTNAARIILEGLKSLEYRGYDSWGVAVVPSKINQGGIYIKKRVGKISDATVDGLPQSSFGFGHTRWATHGGVTEINAHPQLDCTGAVAVVHNGIIENYDEIKKELLKKGHRFFSDTDTEVAAHLIEEFAKKEGFVKAVAKAFNRFKGFNAIIAINSHNNILMAVRNGSPLVVGFGKGENFIASDPLALLPQTKKVYFLEDKELVIMAKDRVELVDVISGKKKSFRKINLTWQTKAAEKGSFPYFMLKEIYEQPSIVKDIAKNRLKQINQLSKMIKKSYGTYLVGCGTAAHAALAGAYFFSKIAKRHVNWAIASEFPYQLDFLTSKSLVIALSQSGETMDTLEAVRKAKEKDSQIAAIVNVLGSTLYREADFKLPIGAGPEKGVASTKAFIGKLSCLILLAYSLLGKIKEGKNLLLQTAASCQKLLSSYNIARIKKLSQILKNKDHKDHIYIIGRGLSYPASLETALKIKEISYIHAEGFAAGELKHGVLALVEKGTPCLVFAPKDETYGANLAGAMEMKARGGFIIGISFKTHEVFDYFIPVEDTNEATIISNVLVGQLLAYYLTIARGLDPDKPRNLAKSVTVK